MNTNEEIKKLKRPDMVIKVKQQIVKEQVNETRLASIPRNFYQQVRLWEEEATKEEINDLKWQLNRLFRYRMGKLLMFSSVAEPDDFEANISDEEWDYCEKIFKLSKELKDLIMGKSVESVRD